MTEDMTKDMTEVHESTNNSNSLKALVYLTVQTV